MEIERGDDETLDGLPMDCLTRDYTNVVTEIWRETQYNFWYICPQDDAKGYAILCSAGWPPYTWHEPLPVAMEAIRSGLQQIRDDLA
jgi:hypothetical protein